MASRNYTIAPAGAWSERVEAQGFASPVWVDGGGNSVGTAFMLTDDANNTMTLALPEAQFGTPGSGWGYRVLTGQDGFQPDQARAFTATAGAFSFGVCAPAGRVRSAPSIPRPCRRRWTSSLRLASTRDTELDPTHGSVVIQPVTVP